MKWQGRRGSENVEDRRGMGGGTMLAGGGIGTVVLFLVAMFLGVDPRSMPDLGGGAAPAAETRTASPEYDPNAEFVSVVLADTEEVWTDVFREQLNREYRKPTLVLFDDRVRSACGTASSAVGPFYCPNDAKIYLDLGFFHQLKSRFGAPGDFAQAYVVAHEVGHHVQNELGILDQVHGKQRGLGERESNALQVRVELQADFLAGVWARHANERFGSLEPGDIEEAMGAASAIGDDTLQREAQGHVVPDSFTHGSSEQRVRWFRRGYETGDLRQGDTFRASSL